MGIAVLGTSGNCEATAEVKTCIPVDIAEANIGQLTQGANGICWDFCLNIVTVNCSLPNKISTPHFGMLTVHYGNSTDVDLDCRLYQQASQTSLVEALVL